MDVTVKATQINMAPEFLSGGGELGEMIRNYDWASTALGPVEAWPQSLKTCIRIMLTSRQPIWIGWGKELIKFYNDPYKQIVGGKHPWALGKPASVVWKDIWKDIEPMLKQVMEQDEGTYVESQLLIMERNGYPEETYYTFSYTPIPGDDGRTSGMFCANTDDTDKIISERQLRTLTFLGKNLSDCRSNEEIIERTMRTLEDNPQDFPFVLFRTVVDGKAILEKSTNLGDAAYMIPKEIDLYSSHPTAATLRRAIETRRPQPFEGLRKTIGELPKGPWEVSPDKVLVLPIIQSGMKEPYGLLIVGLNPYRLLDEKYLGFFSLIGDQVATSFADVHVLEEERKRAQALAEIDRAKTTFFSNISHEFRTPLTLLLGPIEDTLIDPGTRHENKLRMEVAYRNALRMQRLVNTLLEFSRIEAGRVEGKFVRADVCMLTRELVSGFRSAIEKAGMELSFECSNPSIEVYLDVEMWEKIVLNLVSNAFKYTKNGGITISIREDKNDVLLSVKDTGIGIPAEQLNKIFERFHRIENVHGRSQEGTGIGLSMVKELVRLHHGTITVDSEISKGSVFTVTIPKGKTHLPADKVEEMPLARQTSLYGESVMQEAARWLPEEVHPLNGSQQIPGGITAKKSFTVLLADDNADMRDYVSRILNPSFRVVAAADGEEAFSKILSENPDLVLTDVMMPKIDGFELLKKIRNHPDKKNLPVIFLSARAGDEAKIEGLDAGADDYLVKPFSARELLARVEGNLKIASNRIAAENNLRNVIAQAPVAMAILRGENQVFDIVNKKALEIIGKVREDILGKPALEVLSELSLQGFGEIFKSVWHGKPFAANERAVEIVRYGQTDLLYLDFIFEPLRNSEGEIEGIIAVGIDVSEQVKSRRKIEQSEQEFKQMANAVPDLVWVANADGGVYYFNDRISDFAKLEKWANGTWQWIEAIHPDDVMQSSVTWTSAITKGEVYQTEHRIRMKDGGYRWHLSRALPLKDDEGNIVKWFGTSTNIQNAREHQSVLENEVKARTAKLLELNETLQRSNNELQQFAHVASHDLKEPVRKIKTFTGRLADDPGNNFTEKSKVYIEKINAASDRMYSMINGVLNYSLVNKTEQVIEPVDLNVLLKHIESDLELFIDEKKAKVQVAELPRVEGSAVLLYQLFYNLLNNSLKFSRSAVLPVITISPQSDPSGQYAVIKVEDNGIGFEQRYADMIFDSFTRLNSKDAYEGTGLGLSLCKRIVERHEGRIEAIGVPNAGSTFIIHLPFHQQRSSV